MSDEQRSRAPQEGDDALRAEEPPPFGRSWRTLYAAVLLNLALLVLLLYLFTRAFS
jgi:hypothetical protein